MNASIETFLNLGRIESVGIQSLRIWLLGSQSPSRWGATTFGITTVSIMTLSITSLSIKTYSIKVKNT
jgi:hypothetical protein